MKNIKTFNSQERLQLLLEIGDILSSSLDYSENLANIASLITPALADWCAVDILNEEDDLKRLAVSHIDPEKIRYAYEIHEKYPPVKNYNAGAYKVVATGKSEFYPNISKELIRSIVKDDQQYKIMMELGLRSAVSVPLRAGEKIFGVLTLITSDTDYHYTREDLLYAELLAKRAGLAIENSRLYEQAKNLSVEMEAQKERLDDIISSVPGIVWEIWNEGAGKKNFINNYFEQMLGYKIEEWVSNPELMFNMIHPDDREKLRKETELRLRGENPSDYTAQFRITKKDGTILWAETKTSTVYDHSGKPLGIRGITIDVTERKRIEDRLSLVIESSPNSLIMTDDKGKITLVNTQAEKLFGYSREELIGLSIEKLIPVRLRKNHPGYRNEFLANPVSRPMGAGRDLYALKKDGSEVPVEIGLSPVKTDEGFFILSSIVDITERRKIEKKIEASLREKEVLLKEIHHRVKNNLQIISSLLNLQSSFLADTESITALSESQNRIRSMALIHEKLYQTMDLSRINFKEYVEELVGNLFNSYNSDSNVSYNINIEEIYLNVDLAISLGLIINELVTNSFKYAFPDKEGNIFIKISDENENVKVIINDNGIGLPEGFDIFNTNTLGLQLVHSLVEQVSGKIDSASDSGTQFVITFPKDNADEDN